MPLGDFQLHHGGLGAHHFNIRAFSSTDCFEILTSCFYIQFVSRYQVFGING